MLPESLKTGDIVEYVCREIEWVKSEVRKARGERAAQRPRRSAPGREGSSSRRLDTGG